MKQVMNEMAFFCVLLLLFLMFYLFTFIDGGREG